jgi:hypothetical protein
MKLAGKNAKWPSLAPVVASSWPKDAAYSPLVKIVDGAGRPVTPGAINCPVVGTATP